MKIATAIETDGSPFTAEHVNTELEKPLVVIKTKMARQSKPRLAFNGSPSYTQLAGIYDYTVAVFYRSLFNVHNVHCL